jgi:ribosomal protein S18 acetylase RimI-like enzyme
MLDLAPETANALVNSKQKGQSVALAGEYMDIIRLPNDEAAVRRYVEDLWLPYNRELETIVEGFALADDVNLVAEELEYRLDLLGTESYRTWIAVDGLSNEVGLADVSGEFAGFVTTDIDESPSVFGRPDRLTVCDIYVREPYRGTGLACELIDRARIRARESGCAELTLDVDIDNERAIAFYEKLGFEPFGHTLVTSTDEQ